MESTHELKTIPDDELLRQLADLLRQSRHAEADLIAHIGEVDARRLYAREASPSMFAYCTEVLHLSEAEAYLRIAAARASREHPALLEMLADGRLHLTAVAKLAPHLTLENRESLLARATHKSKREIEELIAELAPRPDVPAVLRKLPERPGRADSPLELREDAVAGHPLEWRMDGAAVHPNGPEPDGLVLRPDAVSGSATPGRARSAVIEPLAPARYKVQFTASAKLHDKLERLRALMRSSVPDGDLAAVIESAVTEKLERLESRRFARTKAPKRTRRPHSIAPSRAESSSSPLGSSLPGANADPCVRSSSSATRHVPAAVRRAVYERDGGQCRYLDGQGRRCPARGGLEFHHRHPFGHGGDHSVENIALLCPAHNSHLADIDYGRTVMARHRRSPKSLVEATPRASSPAKSLPPPVVPGMTSAGRVRSA
jgi:hypothetical protein